MRSINLRLATIAITLAAMLVAAGPASAGHVADSRHLPIRSFDGTVLDGWVHLPKVPAGTRVPVVLNLSPYLGNLNVSAADIDRATAEYSMHDARTTGTRFVELVERGYAVALYNMRGSGNSGGCHDAFGSNDQRDAATLVEALAKQPFSNGRVATIGKSIPGFAALAAAARGAEGLRAVIAISPLTSLFNMAFTPQSGQNQWAGLQVGPSRHAISLAPSVDTNPETIPQSALATALTYPGAAAGAACPEIAEQLRAMPLDPALGRRDERFWRERDLLPQLARSSTPILITSGLHDSVAWNMQEFDWWRALQRGPRRLLLSQVMHTWPKTPSGAPFEQEVLAWLDHFLRGGPAPDGLGRVDFEDRGGRWHEDHAWPATRRRDEVLHLAGDELRPVAASGDRRFLATRDALNTTWIDNDFGSGYAAVCPGRTDPAVSATYLSVPVERRAVIAGHPMAYLRLSSNLPAGVIEASLYALPAAGCTAQSPARFLGLGAADLRLHAGGWEGTPFPTDRPEHVRIDFPAMAEHLEPGERLALLLNGGETHVPDAFMPLLTVHADGAAPSQLVLPLVEGTLGGDRPRIDYPPRPHALER